MTVKEVVIDRGLIGGLEYLEAQIAALTKELAARTDRVETPASPEEEEVEDNA